MTDSLDRSAVTSFEMVTRLTPGEFATAVQAAAGHSDKEIARARTLSVRTIQSQLLRTYDKLGLSGRRELAGALEDGSGAQPAAAT